MHTVRADLALLWAVILTFGGFIAGVVAGHHNVDFKLDTLVKIAQIAILPITLGAAALGSFLTVKHADRVHRRQLAEKRSSEAALIYAWLMELRDLCVYIETIPGFRVHEDHSYQKLSGFQANLPRWRALFGLTVVDETQTIFAAKLHRLHEIMRAADVPGPIAQIPNLAERERVTREVAAIREDLEAAAEAWAKIAFIDDEAFAFEKAQYVPRFPQVPPVDDAIAPAGRAE